MPLALRTKGVIFVVVMGWFYWNSLKPWERKYWTRKILGAPEPPEPCGGCLNWTQLYFSGGVRCGDALENWDPDTKEPIHNDGGNCFHKFFHVRLTEPECIKTHPSSQLLATGSLPFDATWCYVSSQCTDLNGGAQVNSHISWKICKQGEDLRYTDQPPAVLRQRIVSNGVYAMRDNPTLMVLFSYPYIRDEWKNVASFFGEEVEGAAPLAPEKQEELRDIVASGRPTVICDKAADGQRHACDPNPGHLHVVAGQELWFFPHFDMPRCVQGCEGTEDAEGSCPAAGCPGKEVAEASGAETTPRLGQDAEGSCPAGGCPGKQEVAEASGAEGDAASVSP